VLDIKYIVIVILIFIAGCEEKAKPVIISNSSIQKPISCLALERVDNNDLVKKLESLYKFSDNCEYKLALKYKKDIVCNSAYNANMKSMGKFPKSFIQLEVRKGLTPVYSYYVDLYHNANSDDLKEGFDRLKKDILIVH
jgi:hypothetical protein